MKIRNGFVANSSSSSYVCDICNKVTEVVDSDFEYSGLIFCPKGHVVDEFHLEKDILKEIKKALSKEDSIKKIEETIEYYRKIKKATKFNTRWYEDMIKKGQELLTDLREVASEEWEGFFEEYIAEYINYGNPFTMETKHCPICNLSHIKEEAKVQYLIKLLGTTNEEVEKLIRNNFNTKDELDEFIEKTS